MPKVRMRKKRPGAKVIGKGKLVKKKKKRSHDPRKKYA